MNWPLALLIATSSLLVGRFVIRFFFKNAECRWLHSHYAPHEQSFDGCSHGGKCSNCGTPVLQDSQGNWFEPLRDSCD